MISLIASRSSGEAASPMSSALVSRPSATATVVSSTAMTTDARPSKTWLPVASCSATPAKATTTPMTAAESSKRTVLVVGSRLART